MREKLDVHNSEQGLAKQLSNFGSNQQINPVNRELILTYLSDAKKGMHGGFSTVGARKRGRYLQFLTQWEGAFKRAPFVKGKKVMLSMAEYRELTDMLSNDVLKCENGRTYADSTKASMYITLNSFLKWLANQGYAMTFIPKAKQKEHLTNPVTIKRELWEDVTSAGRDYQEKALVMTLFDSGARPAELLNLVISDVEKTLNKKIDKKVIVLNVNFSKTFPRRLEIPNATDALTAWLDRHPQRDNPNARIFLMGYDTLRRIFVSCCKEVLKRPFDPYTARRSSLTFYATLLKEAQLAYRAGQVVGSRALRRYVNREALEGNEVVEKNWENNALGALQKENQEQKQQMLELKNNFDTQFAEFEQKIRSREEQMDLQNSAIIDGLFERYAKLLKLKQKN